MAQNVDIENDPFLALLTDALRAGPGSPEWREAVSKLKAENGKTDEYRLLIEAREALESGKEYRSVRAGPGFTRKLLSNIENEQATAAVKRPFPFALVVALLALIVIAAVVGVAIYELYPREQITQDTKSINELASTYLANEVFSTTFSGDVPSNWRKIGSLPVEAGNGLTVGAGMDAGGGIVATNPVPADQVFSATVSLRVASPGENLLPQVFISNSPDFSPDRATAEQELVWQLKGNEQTVVVGGRVENQAALPPHTPNVSVRLLVNRDLAIVESDGKRLWAGSNHLGDKPRYLGVRFIRASSKGSADIAIQSYRLQTK